MSIWSHLVGLAIVSDDDDDNDDDDNGDDDNESLIADLADGWQRAPVSS